MLKLSEYAKQLQAEGYTIIFEAIPEELDFRIEMQECMTDEEMENYSGEWFCAKVSLSFCGLTSKDNYMDEYLGGCAYDSLNDFTSENGCYFDDMLKTCVHKLNNNILTAYTLLNL